MESIYPTVPLCEICEAIQYGFTARASTAQVGPHFVRITDIVPERLDWDNVPYCEIEEKKLAKYRLETGDIVIARTGATTGWAKYIQDPPESVFASYLVRVRPSSSVVGRFIGFVVESSLYKGFVQQHMGGSAQPNANAKVLTSFILPLPPVAIQDRIASILSAYNDLIENCQRRIKVLESMARALYREWFVHFRFPGHENHPMVDSELGMIPVGWEITTFGCLVNFRKGKNITKKTIRPGEVPVVAGGKTPAYYHDSANTERPVITVSASGANAGFVNLHYVDVWASDCSYIDASATRYIYYYYLWLDYRRAQITHLQRGSAQPHVYSKDLAQLDAIKVPDDKLNNFTEQVTPVFELIESLISQIQNLRSTRDLLLPRLLSGQIRIGELHD